MKIIKNQTWKKNRFFLIPFFFFLLFPIIVFGVQINAPDVGSTDSSIPQFLANFYKFAIMISGVLAVGMIIWGGILYTLSGASISKKNNGKELILSALFGLALVLGSYLILNTINPRLVELENPGGQLEQADFTDCSSSTMVNSGNGIVSGVGEELRVCELNEWPRSYETGQCQCYPDTKWIENHKFQLTNETEIYEVKLTGISNNPPTQTGCCVNIDKKITLKWPSVGYETDRGVNELLVRLINAQGLKPWRVTAACPDKPGAHQSSCHYKPKCTCVDIAIDKTKVSDIKCGDVYKLIEVAKGVGFRVLNEYRNCDGVQTQKSTGGHLHIGI